MDKIKCEVVRDLMPLVADDVASAESKELVNGHIEDCEVCKAYYAGMTAQMVRAALPDDGPTSTFVKFTHQMEKRVRMKKVLIALTAAFVALCVAIVGGYVVFDKMYTYVPMDIDKSKVWLWRGYYGEVNLAIKMEEDHGWYYHLGLHRDGDIYYLTPYEPELMMWNKGVNGDLYAETMLDLMWEDGQLYYVYSVANDVYNVETDRYEAVDNQFKIPIRLVRWGDHDNFTTLYEQGDAIMTYEEVYEIAYPLEDDSEGKPAVTPVPSAAAAVKE